jgi:hypothetical protein
VGRHHGNGTLTNRVARLIVIAALGLFFVQPVLAQSGVIDGVVTDTSLAPLAGARVSISGTSIAVATLAGGRFRIENLPAGLYLLSVAKMGYEPSVTTVRLIAGDTLRPAYALTPSGTRLGAVKVTGERSSPKKQEFEDRKALGHGAFMSEEEIDKRNTARATELLRTFSTIEVAAPIGSRSASAPQYFAVSRRKGSHGGPCVMAIVVDGNPMPTPYDLEELPSPKEMLGIEVYASAATIPVQWKRWDTGCGLIMIWMKDGSPSDTQQSTSASGALITMEPGYVPQHQDAFQF